MDVYVDTCIREVGEAAGFLPESLGKERIVGQTQRDNFQKAHEAGVRMAFCSDAGVNSRGKPLEDIRELEDLHFVMKGGEI